MADGKAGMRVRALLAWLPLAASAAVGAQAMPAVPAASSTPITPITPATQSVQATDLPPALIATPLPPPGSMAARVLACTACHGPEGRATPGGYFPRIAGKPAGYLYRQLKNFQQGRRSYPAMNRLIEFMPDPYLREIAEHFAGLDLPYAPPAPPAPSTAGMPLPAMLALGERLALQGDAQRKLPACAACHGAQLLGAGDDIPGLLGLSRDYLNSQIGAWRSGQRQAAAPDCMEQVAKALTPQEVVAVTAWLSSRAAQPGAYRQAASAQLSLPLSLPLRCGAVASSAAADAAGKGRP